LLKGYAIFTERVHDPDGMGSYAGKVVPTILARGGMPIVAGAPAQVLEGDWHGTQTVILEFPSVDDARSWFESDEYQAIIGERHAAAETNAIIIEGFELPNG